MCAVHVCLCLASNMFRFLNYVLMLYAVVICGSYGCNAFRYELSYYENCSHKLIHLYFSLVCSFDFFAISDVYHQSSKQLNALYTYDTTSFSFCNRMLAKACKRQTQHNITVLDYTRLLADMQATVYFIITFETNV